VKVVPDHPELGVAARHAAIDFHLADDPNFRDLAVDREANEAYSAYYRIPRGPKDLLARSKLVETATALGATLVILVKEIGTDALFALRHRIEALPLSAALMLLLLAGPGYVLWSRHGRVGA